MHTKLFVATIFGSLLTAGACLAGDVSPGNTSDVVDAAIVRGQPVGFAEARASLDAAIETETHATKELQAAVSDKDSAQIALADAEEHLDDLVAILDGGALAKPLRARLEREAAALQDTIDTKLFTRLDAARDRVMNAKQDLRAAQSVKQAAIEQVRLVPAPAADHLTYSARYDSSPLSGRASLFE